MKKIWKTAAVSALALCVAAGAAACKNGVTSYSGEYSYETEYGTYGVKVNVFVSGDVIDRVEIVESDYIEVTPSWEGNTVYTEGRQALLNSFAGKSVSSVLGFGVTVGEDGAPTGVDADGISVITGATQSTGRLLLAVKNALEKTDAKS